MSRIDLQEMTNLWLQYVKHKPVYDRIYMSDKAKCLALHLSNSNKKGKEKITHANCRQLLAKAELRLMNQEMGDEQYEAGEADEERLEEDCAMEGVEEHISNENRGEAADMEVGVGMEEMEDNVDDDEDWSVETRKDRTEREWMTEKLLQKSDEEIFESGDLEWSLEDNSLVHSEKFKFRREEYGWTLCEEMSDRDLFELQDVTNKHLLKTEAYKRRKHAYCSTYFEEHIEGESSQNILCVMSQTSQVVT
jgi:hypothetical protein